MSEPIHLGLDQGYVSALCRVKTCSLAGEMNDIPKHLLLRRELEKDIARLPPHAQLPTERELTARFEVSRMTLRQALGGLLDDGVIYRIGRTGTFVAESRISKDRSLTSFTEDMRARGMVPSSSVIDVAAEPADDTQARDFRIEPDTPLARIERLRLADGIPMCHEVVRVPLQLMPDILTVELTGSLYDLFARRFRIRVASSIQRTRAIAVDHPIARWLMVPAKEPALQVRRITSDTTSQVVEIATSTYRADRYDFTHLIRRQSS